MFKKISLLAIIATAFVVPTSFALGARYQYTHVSYNSNMYPYSSRQVSYPLYSRPSRVPYYYTLPNYAPWDQLGILLEENASYVSQARYTNILYPRYGY
ncbi:hypothetical protein KW791_03610 [Candidatus Parcubacteria bacterium]|nr:hypothetical protein [Candidatus Parcubacteria bacterium]